MSKSLFWSVKIFVRHLPLFFVLSLLISALVLFCATQIKLTLEKKQLVEKYQKFPFDLIAPKGSDIEILQNILSKSKAPDDFLPSNLFHSLKEGPVEMLGVRSCGESGALQCVAFLGPAEKFIFSAPQVKDLKEDEVLVSEKMVDSMGLKVGQLLQFDFRPKNSLSSAIPVRRKLVGTFQSSIEAFDYMALTSAASTDKLYHSSSWEPEQIWKSDVLNLILVQGPDSAIKKLEEIVNKRTVSFFVRSQSTLASAMSLFDIRTSVQRQNLYLGLIATASALFLLALSIYERLAEFLLVTSRLGYSRGFHLQVIALNLLYCLLLGLLIYSGLAWVM